MKFPAPNRLAVYLTAVAGLLTALAPIVANLDLTSTVGVVAGLAAVTTVVSRWLTGWQNLEKAEAQNTVLALQSEREAALRAEQVAAATAPVGRKLNLPR